MRWWTWIKPWPISGIVWLGALPLPCLRFADSIAMQRNSSLQQPFPAPSPAVRPISVKTGGGKSVWFRVPHDLGRSLSHPSLDTEQPLVSDTVFSRVWLDVAWSSRVCRCETETALLFSKELRQGARSVACMFFTLCGYWRCWITISLQLSSKALCIAFDVLHQLHDEHIIPIFLVYSWWWYVWRQLPF